jgi:hypothetical protein
MSAVSPVEQQVSNTLLFVDFGQSHHWPSLRMWGRTIASYVKRLTLLGGTAEEYYAQSFADGTFYDMTRI